MCGNKEIEMKKRPINIHISEYIGSKFFLLTNKRITKIITIPIKKAINLECRDIIIPNF